MGQPVHRVDAEHRERDEAPAGYPGHARQHQPRREPGQQVGYPFAPPVAVSCMASQYERTPLQAATRQAIDRANAEKLFPRLA